ncbi:nucleotidyl transferase AbiEii/AbiGii toxin family protein [Conexivisphaera calida]|uniref:Uncharacterized protein n=1 Tax=Conexivisphaera calida TaxID=1874277 RepID=A0A4P2VDW6_9ARCH|nr:nucleotidyl transferase AbiEii/AbiGii toxin family protein [Conexivisphaera calida]BBE42799.1 hypothetical protein NAS2_1412 [Conexivisphaera calida]
MIELSRRFDFVLHGGTAVWRIYGGKRFSYDVDVYLAKPEDVLRFLSDAGWAELTKRRITGTGRAFFRMENRVPVELEISPPPEGLRPVEGDFWLTDGTSMVVKTLSPEDLLREKVDAFIDRRKARDLYDIYYLLDFCERERIMDSLGKLLPLLESPPGDFAVLRELVLVGRAPDFDAIRFKVRAYAED